MKFGVIKVTFHNYTITREGTQPKDANLCPIRNMTSLSDVSQVKAFLGCCQQMSQYIKGYGITASPLRGLTKKARPFPKPWIKGEDYDLSFESLSQPTFCITRTAPKDCSSKLMQAMKAGGRVRIRWSHHGQATQRKKAEEGKATLALEWSFNGPAKRGRHLS